MASQKVLKETRRYGYPTNQLIEYLNAQGYVVRHTSEARTVLQWHRTMPFPRGVDFEQEALEKIKGQLQLDHLMIETRERPSSIRTIPLPRPRPGPYLRALR